MFAFNSLEEVRVETVDPRAPDDGKLQKTLRAHISLPSASFNTALLPPNLNLPLPVHHNLSLPAHPNLCSIPPNHLLWSSLQQNKTDQPQDPTPRARG